MDRRQMKRILLLLYLLGTVCRTAALIEGLYCGNVDCYDGPGTECCLGQLCNLLKPTIQTTSPNTLQSQATTRPPSVHILEVERSVDSAGIRRAYRKLAVRYHPDKYKGPDAHEKFLLISTAYEILKDEEERSNYDFMLDNPEMVYRHYYHYYKRRVTPKVDVRVVIAVTIVVISLLQYLAWWHTYSSAITFALQMPKYRTKAKEIAKERGLWNDLKKKKMPKWDVKAWEEEILRRIVEENLDIIGGYSKPQVWDVLLFKIIFFPYRVVQYVAWNVRWIWRFDYKGMEYGPEEKVYLTRRILRLSPTQWEAIPTDKQDEMVGYELWLRDNLEQYNQRQEEEMKIKLAGSNKHKSYRRYVKNH